MKKMVLTGFAVATMIGGFSSNAAIAMTKPTDIVNVMMFFEDPTSLDKVGEKRYTKPFGQLKLDAKTKKQIEELNKKLDKINGVEKFRLAWIRLGDDRVQGYMFQGDHSTVWLVEYLRTAEGEIENHLNFSLDGNGGASCGSNRL